MEQAFVLIGDHGFCGAATIIAERIHAAPRDDMRAAEAWVSIGQCINRIAALQTVH